MPLPLILVLLLGAGVEEAKLAGVHETWTDACRPCGHHEWGHACLPGSGRLCTYLSPCLVLCPYPCPNLCLYLDTYPCPYRRRSANGGLCWPFVYCASSARGSEEIGEMVLPFYSECPEKLICLCAPSWLRMRCSEVQAPVPSAVLLIGLVCHRHVTHPRACQYATTAQCVFIRRVMSSNILDASALISLLPSVLPPDSKSLASQQDGLTALVHTVFIALAFRLTAVDDSAADISDGKVLPPRWNQTGPAHFALKYRHDQSSLEFLLNVSKLGSRTLFNAIALEVRC